MKFLKWLKKQLDKLPSSPGLQKSGNWYVRYPDTKRTRNVTYDSACSLAAIYGGKVFHISDFDQQAGQ